MGSKSTKISDVRIKIFASWVAFWVFSTIAVVLAPFTRSDGAIGDEQVIPAIMALTGIWLPPLTCFATFWFPQDHRKAAQRRTINRERKIGAYVITFCYHFFVVILVARALYLVSYTSTTLELLAGNSFEEQISLVVTAGTLISPFALAPTIWITGGPENET